MMMPTGCVRLPVVEAMIRGWLVGIEHYLGTHDLGDDPVGRARFEARADAYRRVLALIDGDE